MTIPTDVASTTLEEVGVVPRRVVGDRTRLDQRGGIVAVDASSLALDQVLSDVPCDEAVPNGWRFPREPRACSSRSFGPLHSVEDVLDRRRLPDPNGISNRCLTELLGDPRLELCDQTFIAFRVPRGCPARRHA